MNKKLWHKASERPKPESSIILVHHYFFDEQTVETAWVHKNGYRFNLNYPRDNDWYDWEWKIDKWCYVEDLLKIE